MGPSSMRSSKMTLGILEVCLVNLIIISAVRCQTTTDDIILFVNRTYIHTVRTDNTSHHIIPLRDLDKAKYVDYDPTENKIYWSDISKGTISRAGYCGDNQEAILSITKNALVSIAIDSKNRKIYWTDPTFDKISTANLDGSGETVIAQYEMSFPRDIAVDSVNKWVYWIDSGTKPKIERCKPNGDNRQIIVDMPRAYPSALALDVLNQKIYWNDNSKRQLLEANTDGSGQRVLASGSFPLMTGLSILDGYLYWPDFYGEKVERLKVTAGFERRDVFGKETDMEDLVALRVDKSVTSCPPSQPTDFQVIEVGNVSAIFSWNYGYGWGLDQFFYIEERLANGEWKSAATILGQGKQSTVYQLEDLQPKRNYILRLYPCNIHRCQKDGALVANITTAGAPDVNASLISDSISNNSVGVAWISGHNWGAAQTFKIEQRQINGGRYWSVARVLPDVGPGTRMRYNVINLRPKTEYAFRLRSCNIYGCVVDGPIRRKTLGPPSLPVNFEAQDITNVTMVIHWRSRYDGGSAQTFYLEERLTSKWKRLAALQEDDPAIKEHKHRVIGLIPLNTYIFRLFSCNKYGCTRKSKRVKSFRTLGPPSSPSSFSVQGARDTWVKFTWSPREDGGSPQMFYLQRNGNEVAEVMDTGSGLQTYTMFGLAPNTLYTVQLYSCNIYGCSQNNNNTLAVTTLGPPTPPTSFRHVMVNTTWINFTWIPEDDGGGSQTFYLQQACICNDNNWTVVANVTDTEGDTVHTYTLYDLSPDTVYQFRLSTCNEFGCSVNNTSALTVKTLGSSELDGVDETADGRYTSGLDSIWVIVIIIVSAAVLIIIILVVVIVKCTRKESSPKPSNNVKYSGVNTDGKDPKWV